MTDEQNIADIWLSRMVDVEGEIVQLDIRRRQLLEQGVPNYDPEKVIGGSDPNPSESRYIEYSYICSQIEKRCDRLARENIRTHQVIDKVEKTLYRELLIGHYINQKSWEEVGKEVHYARTQAREHGYRALTAVYPFIPKGEVLFGQYV